MRKLILLVLIVILVVLSIVNIGYAHPNLQSGQIVFGDDVHDLGWNIFDSGVIPHSNSKDIYFYFNPNDLAELDQIIYGTSDFTYRDAVNNAKLLWNNTGVCSITEKPNDFQFYNDYLQNKSLTVVLR